MPSKTKQKETFKSRNIILVTILLLFLLSVLTRYYGSADIGDYADTARFFSGEYQAKLRSSHSILYGLIHAPFVKLTDNFISFKISSVLWLSLLILSLYYMSNKNKKVLLLFTTAPLVWYMAPWINPIQLSSLLFLWGYYFITKYEEKTKLRYLFYSGLLLGLAWAFWESVLYFTIILAFCFLYNKKAVHFLLFFVFLFIGILPKLLVDQFFFGFAFYSILKHFFALLAFTFYGGIYGQQETRTIVNLLFILLMVPFYTFLLCTKKYFTENKKLAIFILLSLFISWFSGGHLRYLFIVLPIIILFLSKTMDNKQFKIQILIFLILTLLVINPYILQIGYKTNGEEFESFVLNLPNLQLTKLSASYEATIQKDLKEIAEDFPNQEFIVGNQPDDYQRLAHLYWDNKIKEFISIQDYELFLKNETTISGKTLCSESKIQNRRDICITIELKKALIDKTDYKNVKYAISLDKNFSLEGFDFIKKYKILSVFEKQ